MKRAVVLFSVLAMLIGSLFADPRLVTQDDPLYELVRNLAIVTQSSPPPTVSPLTYAELESVLRAIDPAELDSGLKQQYAQALRQLTGELEPVPRPAVGVEVALEGYFHTANDADEWLYTYPDRKSLVSLPIRVMPVPHVLLAMDLALRKNYPLYPGRDTVVPDPWSNFPTDVLELEAQFPHYTMVSAAGERWSAQFGRGPIGYGLGHTGSLVLGDHVEWHDYLTFAFFGDLAVYRALYVDLEGWETASVPVLDRMFFAHRIELDPFPWLSLAATDGFILEGLNIELRYFNPLMFLHSFFVPNYGNVILNFEIAARPLPGLELWAHMDIDQWQAPVEIERGYGLTEPSAFGWLAGAEYVMALPEAWLSVGTEWVYLDPWMYIGRTLLQSFTYRRRVQAENAIPAGAKIMIEKSLGYPAGPDHYSVTLFGSYSHGSGLEASVDLLYGAQGENKLGQTVANLTQERAQISTPSGDNPEYFLAAALAASAPVARVELGTLPVVFRAGTRLDLIHIWNNDHVPGAGLFDVQFSPFISASMRSRS